jgi:hypothetical protein
MVAVNSFVANLDKAYRARSPELIRKHYQERPDQPRHGTGHGCERLSTMSGTGSERSW